MRGEVATLGRSRGLPPRWGGAPGLVLALVAALACASAPSRPPLTASEVVELAQGGAGGEEIVTHLRAAGGTYTLRASELARLRDQGVPDAVIDYMQETHLEQVRREQWLEDQARLRDPLLCDPWLGPRY